jgi:hypothetical protein
MDTGWRFVSHRRFQREAAILVAVGGGIGALAWAVPLAGAAWWTATGIGPLVAGLAGREAHLPPRRSLPLVAAVAVAAAALAGLTWQALAAPPPALDLGDALVVGVLAGLAASPALAAAYLGRVVVRPLERALAEARATLAGDERALAERAAAAHARITAGLAGDAGADSRRLGRLAEEVTLQVLGLARRCRSLRGEVERIDVPAVRKRAGALAEAATGSRDEAARADLTRAARAVVALDERAQALAGAAARVRARLELQVAMLEETALAVSAREASAAAGEADAFAPLADRLHDAGRDLADQAQALAEAGSVAR